MDSATASPGSIAIDRRSLDLRGLARKSDSAPSYLWNLEQGRIDRPGAEKLAAVAAALGRFAGPDRRRACAGGVGARSRRGWTRRLRTGPGMPSREAHQTRKSGVFGSNRGSGGALSLSSAVLKWAAAREANQNVATLKFLQIS